MAMMAIIHTRGNIINRTILFDDIIIEVLSSIMVIGTENRSACQTQILVKVVHLGHSIFDIPSLTFHLGPSLIDQIRDLSLLLVPHNPVQPFTCYLTGKLSLSSNSLKVAMKRDYSVWYPNNIVRYGGTFLHSPFNAKL